MSRTNLACHAGVDEVKVQIVLDAETLHLQIEDQGVGAELP
jgi:glucose-6-phosphate-specific signal transduction histidine kinase